MLSKQSLTGFDFLDKLFSPSVPALTLDESIAETKKVIIIFFITV